MTNGKHQEPHTIPPSNRSWRQPLLSVVLHLVLSTAIVTIGESIFRGFQTWQWFTSSPLAASVTIILIATIVFGLQLFGSLVGSAIFTGVLFWILSFADSAKVAKLGIPATPTDLLLSSQYLAVSYMMWGSLAYVVLIACMVITAGLAWWIWKRTRKSNRDRAWLSTTCRMVAIVVIVYLVAVPDYNYYTARYRSSPVADLLDRWGVHNLNFDPLTNAKINGQLLSFLMNARSATIHPPRGYGEERVQAVLGPNYQAAASETPPPDIVVIMSEAFWDPGLLPGISYSDPLLNAAQTTQRGTMFSPVFGGYTANTEFEVLSGISNGILPTGSIPYVQYVRRPTLSLADDLEKVGYQAIALHPFDGNFWNRRHVYQNFSFMSFDDRDSFIHREQVAPFISDWALAEEINMKLEQGTSPHFIFAVSLQSHAPYKGGMYRYANRVTVYDNAHTLTNDARDQLSTYASGVRDAVASFNQVVAHARKSGRKTIVVMFGDHLPALGDGYMLYRQTGFLKTGDPSRWTDIDQEHMHSVPLLIWSNTGTSMELSTDPFSPIYIGYRIKRMAGIGLDRIDRLMERTASSWPILSQVYSKSSSGRIIRGMPHEQATEDYALIAYDLLMGKEYARIDTFRKNKPNP